MTPVPPPTPPFGVEVLPAPGGTVLRRKWFSRWVFVPIFFAAGWDIFAFFFYCLIVSLGPVPGVAMVFPLVGLAVAVVVTYAVLAAVWNRTEITVTTQSVRVDVGPLPWPGNKTVAAAQIREVKVVSRYVGKGGSIHRVLYLDAQCHEHPLLNRAITLDWAEFVATAIRRQLRLPPPAG